MSGFGMQTYEPGIKIWEKSSEGQDRENMIKVPLLTIIVPIYNKAKLLKQCLDSFAADKFRGRLEVLAVDDGSTDASVVTAAEYESRFPEIYRVIKKENGGVGSVMNLGIQYAAGKYIKEVDADDYVDSDALGKLLDFLEECDSDIVLTPFRTVDEEGFTIETHYIKGVEYGREYPADVLLRHAEISIQGLAVKRQLLLEHRIVLEETRYYVDMQIIGESIYYAETYTVMGCILYYYRCNQAEQSVSLKNYVRNREDFRRQTELSLERFSRAQKEEISAIKRGMMKDAACGYSGMLQIIYLMDQSDGDKEKGKAFDGMLRTEHPMVYDEIGRQPLIRELRNNDFNHVHDFQEKILNIVKELQEVNKGFVSLGDVCSQALDEGGNITNYRLRKQRDKLRRQFQLMNDWFMNYQNGITAGQYLWDKGIRRVAIYGFGALGERLYQELSGSQVRAVYGIDRIIAWKDGSFQVEKQPDGTKEIDAIVVTAITDFCDIAAELKKSVKCPIISLEDVVHRS